MAARSAAVRAFVKVLGIVIVAGFAIGLLVPRTTEGKLYVLLATPVVALGAAGIFAFRNRAEERPMSEAELAAFLGSGHERRRAQAIREGEPVLERRHVDVDHARKVARDAVIASLHLAKVEAAPPGLEAYDAAQWHLFYVDPHRYVAVHRESGEARILDLPA
jgi:hypothetical protein